MNKNEKIIFSIIFCGIIAIWFSAFYGNSTNHKTIDTEIDRDLKVLAAKQSAQSFKTAADSISIKKNFEPRILKNPFANTLSLNSGEAADKFINGDTALDGMQLSNLKLSGIVNTKNNKYAIINDNIVKEGQMIFGAVVIKINDRQVMLKQLDQVYYIEMPKPEN